MENDALKQIQDRLAELPADVRAAIQDSNLDAKVREIGGRHSLHIDQIGELGDEVMLTMLGFSPMETFGVHISQTLNLPPQAGEKLAADITAEIFSPIRESMKNWAAQKNAPTTKIDAQPVAVSQNQEAQQKLAPGGEMNTTPTPPGATFAAPAVAVPAPVSPDMHKADVMLSQPTVSPTPAPIYKADPYREPV